MVIAGCDSDDSDELSLGDDAEVDAPEDDAPDDPVEDEPEPSPTEDDEPLYPPLPPLEPDPDSDVPVEGQELGLALHADVYEVTQSALASGDVDEAVLEAHLGGDLLDQMTSSLQERAAAGHVSRAPDTTVAWVEVVFADGGPIVVQECRIVGPRTGTYDQDGQRVDEGRDDPVPVIFETRYALVETTGDETEYRAVEAISAADPETCDA
jgi:hypothetical protein